ncbi:MAG: glycosyltransferase family 1 protein [Chloroflexota bacterium]|nr:MAG: glycosyltransferase family 1 protein [Chloroflexota bacterium]
MRVAMLCASQPRVDDEGWSRESPVIPLSKSLHMAGHQVHIFLPTSATQSSYHLIDGLHYHYVATNSGRPSPRGLTDGLLYYVGATQNVAGTFDVLHAHDAVLLHALGEGHARLKVNTVLSLWTEEQVRSCGAIARGLAWRLDEVVGALVCPSRLVQHVATSVLEMPNDRIFLQYPGISLARWQRWTDQGKLKKQLGFGPFDPLLLSIGEFDRQGNAWMTLEAVFAVRESHPFFRAVLLGDGPLLPYLRDRSRVLGLDGCVRFQCYLPEDQLVELYNGCDIVHLPSAQPASARAIVEAWCAGKPTLISDAAVPEFYDPGTHGLSVPQQVDALAQSIGRLLDDRAGAQTMGQAGWRKVHDEFCWDSLATRAAELYARAAPVASRTRANHMGA